MAQAIIDVKARQFTYEAALGMTGRILGTSPPTTSAEEGVALPTPSVLTGVGATRVWSDACQNEGEG